MHYQMYDQISGGSRISRWGGGGRQPPTRTLFGKNICEKEIDPVGGGAHAGSAPWIRQCKCTFDKRDKLLCKIFQLVPRLIMKYLCIAHYITETYLVRITDLQSETNVQLMDVLGIYSPIKLL